MAPAALRCESGTMRAMRPRHPLTPIRGFALLAAVALALGGCSGRGSSASAVSPPPASSAWARGVTPAWSIDLTVGQVGDPPARHGS